MREALTALRPLFPGLDAAVARAAAIVADERRCRAPCRVARSVREQLADENDLRDIDFLHVEAVGAGARKRPNGGSFYMKPGLALRIESGTVHGYHRGSDEERVRSGSVARHARNDFAIGCGLEHKEI